MTFLLLPGIKGLIAINYILRIQTWMNILVRMRADKKDSGKDKCVSSIDILPTTELIGNAYENLKFSFEDILREKRPNAEFFLVLFSCIRTEYRYLRIQENTGIQSEYRKIRTRKNSTIEQFSRSDSYGMTTMITILSTLLPLNILVGTS